ncbi:VWA domain containing CoxE-like family protein [Pseudooceanicola batsensis HTCC2597]|uniref:VWA domain containing CoxE-like family protein n=1 Tax=Pseudooceanicola batsensis (strain ATCC BAA-863 / DSM 15984 / KCTC 12145 / HTCC2597) TaxID=252305 RepID=A3U1T0_PSEBH|nr:VWA domain-containing protein [Pseudooceanicola batsensis]EAQ01864.1 VWA domain containing CoxE-like family protein [Pseudooceanicola batsensis HTCC2597]
MPEYAPLDLPENPKLAENITHFARALRKAGLPIGPGRTLDAIRAVEAAGFTDKQDFYWTLHACFVSRPQHRQVFSQLFRLYWRDPRYMEHMMAMMLPAVRGVAEERQPEAAEKRAAEALLDGADHPVEQPEEDGGDTDRIEIDASLTMSEEERLRTLDFEQMSTDEIARAKRMLARLTLPVRPIPSRRQSSPRGARIDAARTLRAAMRQGGEVRDLHRSLPRPRWPALVALCDISGSMSQYSRMVLHFLHALANQKGDGWAKVHAFTFGTRLTNITRHLGTRDVDAALAAAGAEAQDWEGGTRIGDCLHDFNRDWSRRVTGQGAVVLLITDGLDRGDPGALGHEMQRLHLSSRRLIWLNPLLRWDGFAPRARGIAAMLPHVDSFRAGHSIASIEDLAEALSRPDDRGEKDRLISALSS